MRKYEVDADKVFELFNKRITKQKRYVDLIVEVIDALFVRDGKVLNAGVQKYLPDGLKYYNNEYNHCIYKPNTSNDYSLYFEKVTGKRTKINIADLEIKYQEEKEKLQKMCASGEDIVGKVQSFNLSLKYYKKAYDELSKIEGFYDYSDYF